eukprot:GDKH01002703.1.p1 GENE.GDKH01002703.1~~GDKH01002703.1.p1  ORF type:complete len:249 (+),score=78.91 GDKH01002703.1:150-896(+)
MQNVDWGKLAIVAAGATAVGAIVWYCLREDKDDVATGPRGGLSGESEMTRDRVVAILDEIIKSQETIQKLMRQMAQDLAKSELSFDDVYNRVHAAQPDDPLEKAGLKMPEFDAVLDKFKDDPAVKVAISKIMGAPTPDSASSPAVQQVTKQRILEIHAFMLEALGSLVNEYQSQANTAKYNMKTVTIAAQAIVGARTEKKFGLSTEQVEAAVLLHSQTLANDHEFARLNMQMQQTMARLLGSDFPMMP